MDHFKRERGEAPPTAGVCTPPCEPTTRARRTSRRRPLAAANASGESWPLTETTILTAFDAGRRKWSRVDLRRADFERHLGAALGAAPSWNWTLRGHELYLCFACAEGQREALRALEDHFLARLRPALMLRLRNRELVEDALQRLRAKLLIGPNPRIATYRGRGSLSGWLAIAVARVAIELRRADRSGREPPAELCSSPATYDPDLTQHMLAERYRDSFSVALHAAVRDLSQADRDLLRRSFVDGCSVDRLGSIYSIHRATAARRLNKARARLVASMRRKVLVRHRFSEDDFDSIARDVSEHVDFSCLTLFEARAAS